MENLEIYEKVRSVPENALKKITGGRLNGKSDINPMWRIRVLTDQFGPCGVGWKYTIDKQWIEQGDGIEQSAFCNISMCVKVGGSWSEPIPGTGGSSFVAQEKGGAYTSDECYKMALTDAISVACKALGIGADVYWSSGNGKYSNGARRDSKKIDVLTGDQLNALRDIILTCKEYNEQQFCKDAKIAKLEDLPSARFQGAFNHVQSIAAKEAQV